MQDEHEQGPLTLSVDAMFELLSSRRRRALLEVLRRHGEPLALADLADEVAVRERGERIDRIPAESVQRVYLSLYHQHVPKLATHGVVAYDQERDIVALEDRAEQLIPLLERAAEIG